MHTLPHFTVRIMMLNMGPCMVSRNEGLEITSEVETIFKEFSALKSWGPNHLYSRILKELAHDIVGLVSKDC